MNVLAFTLMPVILSTLISMFASLFLNEVLPQIAAVSAAASAVSSAAILLCMIGLYRQNCSRGLHTESFLKLQGRKVWLPILCIGFFAVGAAASDASARIMDMAGVYKTFSNETQEALFQAPLWIQLLGPGLLVPCAEELTYRIVLYDRLKAQLPGIVSVLLVSLLFAAGHGNWIQAMYAFPMSLLLCLSYELSGSPAGPIAMHMGANLLSILVMAAV